MLLDQIKVVPMTKRPTRLNASIANSEASFTPKFPGKCWEIVRLNKTKNKITFGVSCSLAFSG